VPDPLQIFIPLRKADAAQRMIYGYATAELPDKAGEICDYASTRPHYEQWSARSVVTGNVPSGWTASINGSRYWTAAQMTFSSEVPPQG
jgi:hypothetical protein